MSSQDISEENLLAEQGHYGRAEARRTDSFAGPAAAPWRTIQDTDAASTE